MVGIVLVSHGQFAEGLKNAAEMIVGPQERLVAIGMEPGATLAVLQKRIEQAAIMIGPLEEVLVLADILGGTPANASAHLLGKGVQIVCGVNLPMLLELLTLRKTTPNGEVTRFAVQAAKEGVIHLS